MTKVVFVGDEPSKTNISTEIAFVGAKCFDRLVEWIKFINPDYYLCLNSDSIEKVIEVGKLYYRENFKVVALGNKASKRLGDIPHFKLPHPSGLNRKINDKKYITKELTKVSLYVGR